MSEVSKIITTFYSDLLLATLLQQITIKELGNPKKRISGVPTDVTRSEKNISRDQSYNLIQMDSSFYLTRSYTVFGNCHNCRNRSFRRSPDEVGINNIDACGHAGTNFNIWKWMIAAIGFAEVVMQQHWTAVIQRRRLWNVGTSADCRRFCRWCGVRKVRRFFPTFSPSSLGVFGRLKKLFIWG